MNSVILSLGRNCEPRGYLKATYNLSKKNGYKSSPFDLCVTSADALYKLLKQTSIIFLMA